MERIEGLKWLELRFFKRNINDKSEYISSKYFSTRAGVVFWSIAGYITQDKPVLANFGLQFHFLL